MRIQISENQNSQDLENFIEILREKGASVRVEKEGEIFYLVIE